MALISKLSAIGDALRAKTETSELYLLDDMPAAIAAITTAAPLPYTVGFSCLYGTAPDPIVVGYVTAPPQLPQRDGYTWRGWYVDEACTQVWDTSQPIQADTTIYDGWTIDAPTVKAKHNNSDDTNTYTVTVAGEGQTAWIRPTDGDWMEGASLNTPATQVEWKVTAPHCQDITGTQDEVLTIVYGISRPDNSSSSAWTRTDAAADFAEPVAAIGTGSGSSPFDNCMPWSGMERVTIDGNILVKIPKFWVKVETASTGEVIGIKIADNEMEGFEVSPMHCDRGDGKGERDVAYVGAYTCGDDYKSVSGQSPKVSITRATARTGIANLGANYWQYDYLTYLTIQYLYLVEFADYDSQSKVGNGFTNSNNVNPIQNNSPGYGESGRSFDKWLTYHTGIPGIVGYESSRHAVRYRWIDNLWGNVNQWVDGIVLNYGTAYVCKNPSQFSDSYSASGYVNTGMVQTGSSHAMGATGVYMMPQSTGGAAVPDQYYSSTSSNRVLRVGGSWYSGSYAGLFCWDVGNGSSYSYSSVGCRLIYLP